MGLFNRLKSPESGASVLSEAEIQKRLYGEFKADPSRVAGASEREPLVSRQTPAAVKVQSEEPSADLFAPVREAPEKTARPETFVTSREIKIPESVSKTSEPKIDHRSSYASGAQAGSFSRVPDPKKRFIPAATPGKSAIGAISSAGTFLARFFDPEHVLVRQVLYWVVGVLAVFFLFWGVNALNVKREIAMKAPRATAAQDLSSVGPKELSGSTQPSSEAVSQTLESGPSSVAVVTGRPAPEPERQPAATPSYAQAGGRFVIQVAVYPSQDYAMRLVDSIKRNGFNGFVKESVRPSGAVQYWVLIGGFRTASDAHQQLKKFKASEVSRPFPDAYIKTIELD